MSLLGSPSTPDLALLGLDAPRRVAVLEQTGVLSQEPDAALDRIASLAAALLQAPRAYVNLVGPEQQFSPGSFDRRGPECAGRVLPLQQSICQFAVATGEPLVISDTREDALTSDKDDVRSGSILAYAGMPLSARGGHVLGSLCVVDTQPRQWDAAQLQLLDDLAAVVVRDLEQRLSARRNADLEALRARLQREVPELLDSVSGLVDLAEQSEEPQFQRHAARARARGQRVRALIEEWSERDHPEELAASQPDEVDLRRTVERAVLAAQGATRPEAVSADLPPGRLLVRCDALRLEQALVHLLVSALHHSSGQAPLMVRLARVAGDDRAAPGSRAELVVAGPGTQVPAAELSRIVARFAQTLCSEDQSGPGTAALRMIGGELVASRGQVSGRSSRRGLVLRASWQLEPPAAEVIDLR